MAWREHCKVCGKPREAHATSYSYCIDCGRAMQREAYAKRVRAQGRVVVTRKEDPERLTKRIDAGKYRPGKCELCEQVSVKGLGILYRKPGAEGGGVDSDDPEANLMPNPYALACVDCLDVLRLIDAKDWERMLTVLKALTKRNLLRHHVIPDFWKPASGPATVLAYLDSDDTEVDIDPQYYTE